MPKLTVLGSSCSIPRPGRACSAYLIEFPGAAIVADLGSGAFANLIRYRALADIDAIVVSHMHADHFIDVVPLRYALKYGDARRETKLPLYLPPGGADMLHRMTAAFHPETGDDFMGSVFDVRSFDPERGLRIGDVEVRFSPTSHYIPTFAMRFAGEGKCIAYSADTAPDDRVAALAGNADVFVCEATLTRAGELELPHGHLSARQAAALAQRAGVGHLVLSHYPATIDLAAMESDAKAVYSGPLTIADDGLSLEA